MLIPITPTCEAMRLINTDFIREIRPFGTENVGSEILYENGYNVLVKEDPGEIYRIIVHTANEMRLSRYDTD